MLIISTKNKNHKFCGKIKHTSLSVEKLVKGKENFKELIIFL